MSIYRSDAGRAAIEALYDRQVAQLGFPVESRYIETDLGTTHLLVAGPEGAPPFVTFHGGNVTNPLTLGWFEPLVSDFRIFAPDTIGHPGKSAPVRLSGRDDSYGRWVVDVLDDIGLERAILVGGSFGAGIVLRAAAYAPERIEKAMLFIPSGLVSIPFGTMALGLLAPLVRYRLFGTRKNLESVLRPMFAATPIDEDVLEATEAVFEHVRIEAEMPRNATRRELARLEARVLVLTAEHDKLFPAEAVVRRAHEVIPNLEAAEVLPGTPH